MDGRYTTDWAHNMNSPFSQSISYWIPQIPAFWSLPFGLLKMLVPFCPSLYIHLGNPTLLTRKTCKNSVKKLRHMQILHWNFILLLLKYQKTGFSSFIQAISPKEKSYDFLEVWSFKSIYSDFVLYIFPSLLNILVYFIFIFNQRLKLYILSPSECIPGWILRRTMQFFFHQNSLQNLFLHLFITAISSLHIVLLHY